jgi:hypothetical protein
MPDISRSRRGRISRQALLAAAAAAAAPVAARAQARLPAFAGSWVRIATDTARDASFRGELLSITPDSIVVRRELWSAGDHRTISDTVKVPLAAVRSFDMRSGTHRQILPGLGLGALAGGVTFGLAGAALYKPCDTKNVECIIVQSTRTGVTATYAAVGVIAGSLAGALIGAAIATEEWKPAETESGLRIGLLPRTKGFNARLTYVF